MMRTDQRPETVAAAHGFATDAAFRTVSPPLHLSTTFAFSGFERPGEFDYGRAGNPNRATLGEALARLEGGAAALVTCSGMAAVDLVVSQAATAENNLICLSVDLEHIDDLLADLGQALDRAISVPAPLCRFEELARRENEARKRRDE